MRAAVSNTPVLTKMKTHIMKHEHRAPRIYKLAVLSFRADTASFSDTSQKFGQFRGGGVEN
jgi:hypothetical protein